MVLSPESISSENPLSSASFAERLRKSGRTVLERTTVMTTATGTVTSSTQSMTGEASAMPTNAPATVTTLVAACKISLESEAFTVSISYEMRLMRSPACMPSMSETGRRKILSNTSCRMLRTMFWLRRIMSTESTYENAEETT